MSIKLPQRTPQRLAFRVKSAAERKIRQGHPWVFDGAIVKQNKEGEAGDLAIIFDQKKNKLLAIGLYDPYSPIRIKVLQSLQPVNIDREWFNKKIENAKALRAPLLTTATNSYRLLYGENDGLPGLVVDVYANVAVLKLYSLIWLPYLQYLCPLIMAHSNTSVLVLRLSRNVQQQKEQLGALADGQVLYGELHDPVVIFREHGLQFAAHVLDGHKTGYFLDHRHNRKRVGELATERHVLDVFAYAGGFSVHALAGGAKAVTALDISKQALAMAKRNAALNTDKPLHTIAADAFKGLQELQQQGQQFDLIIVDPPSFAKQASEYDGAMHSYERLAKLAIPLISKGGILVLASCSSRVPAEDFFALCVNTLQQSGRPFREMERTLHDIDHPIIIKEGAYLKCSIFELK